MAERWHPEPLMHTPDDDRCFVAEDKRAFRHTRAKLPFNCLSASLGAGNDRTFAAKRITSLHSQHPRLHAGSSTGVPQ
jgi:hypothetical protein